MSVRLYYRVIPYDGEYFQEETLTLHGALDFVQFFLRKGVSCSIYKCLHFDSLTEVPLGKVGQFNAK